MQSIWHSYGCSPCPRLGLLLSVNSSFTGLRQGEQPIGTLHLGHDAGDMALREFADKLREFADKRNALACRYGGDEFVLFAPVRDDADIEAFACELSKTQRGSVEGNGKEYVYSTSIGICPYPLEGFLSFEEALQAADQALYKAKQRGRATFAVYEPDENARRG
ncbi:GGDEF domain-containing protein [Desulfovibrio porci]|uniref:GGDEF domain-containing protein n=1 Tax=Desulfovibrio porci TaxID=2605782 RepID=UPI002DDA6C6F|nr:GGDEF domain-containing protein [Desulfovibrio porci]